MVVVAAGPVGAEASSPQQQLSFDIYKELVEINTVTATGDTAQAAGAMAAPLPAAGLAEADIHVFQPGPPRGPWGSRNRGGGSQNRTLLVAHLDVSPASRDDWSAEPFKLTEQDGYFY